MSRWFKWFLAWLTRAARPVPGRAVSSARQMGSGNIRGKLVKSGHMVVQVDRPEDMLPRIKGILEDAGIYGRPIGLRAFELSRLEFVLKFGTDRGEDSSKWACPGDDYDHHACPTVGSERITYLRVFDIARSPDVKRTFDLEKGRESLDQLEEWWAGEPEGILLYDIQFLDQKADNEFWFKGDPLEALVAVLWVDTDWSE